MPFTYPSRPEMKVEIAFVDNPLGNDPEDDAQISIGGGVGLPTGWTDVTAYTREVGIDRGRSNDLERVETGTASVILDNRDRRFDPVYEAGPYWDPGSSAARTNLLRNPNFQYGIGNWFAQYSTVTPITGGYFRQGKGIQVQCLDASQKVSASNYSDHVGTTTSRTAVTEGLQYTFTVWGYMVGVGRTGSAVLQWYDSAGVALTTSTGSSAGWNNTDSLRNRATVTATAPIGATSVVPYFQISSAAATDYIVIDYALLEQAATIGQFFDGDEAGCYWVNVAGDSQSVMTDGAVNIAQDPSVETTIAGTSLNNWIISGGSAPTPTGIASTDTSFVGDQSAKLSRAASSSELVFLGPEFSFAAGEQYNISFAGFQNQTGKSPSSATVYLQLFNDSLTFLTQINLGTFSPSSNDWSFFSANTTPASSNTTYAVASKARVQLNIAWTDAAPNPLYIDAVLVYPGTLTQPYIDGDMSGYEWTGTRGDSSSQSLVRAAGTLLKPRRQIQVHAVFPNDSIADNNCRDLVDGGTVSRGSASCEFTRSGLMQYGSTATSYTSTSQAFTTTELSVYAQIKPYQRKDWYAMDCSLWNFNDRIAFTLFNGSLSVWVYYSGVWNKEWTSALPTTMRFDTPDSHWFKVNIVRQAFGAPGEHRLRIKVYTTVGQMPVPEVLTQIGTEAVTVNSTLIPALTGGTIRVGFRSAGNFPVNTSLNNRFQIARLAIDDEIADQRTCDIMFDTHHTLFRGFTRGWRQQYAMTGKDATVPLECFDMLGVVGSMTMPTDFVTEWAKQRRVWGYWKLGDAGGVAVDYSGNGNDLYYNDGGRLPSTYGPLASGLSGLPTEFKQSLVVGGPALSGYMISNTSGAKYPVDTSATSKDFSVSFWMRSTTPPGTATYKVPLFLLTDSSYWTGLGLDATNRQFLEMGYINSATGTRTGLPYVQWTRLNSPGPYVTTMMYGDTWSKPGPLFQWVDNGDPHFMTAVVRKVTSTLSGLFMYMDGRLLMAAVPFTPGNGGTIVIGGRPDSTTNLYQYAGDMQDVMYFPDYALSDAEVAELYTLSSGIINEDTGERIERLMDFAGVPEYLRAVDPDVYGDCGLISLEEGKSILEAMHQIEDTEAGIVFADREGRLALRGRYFLSMNDLGVTSQADFDDANVGIGYQNLEFNLDADQLANDHTVIDDSEQENEAEDELSVAEYGRRSRTVNTLLRSSEDAYQMAIGLTNIYKNPLLRAEPFDITPTGEQWLKVMPLDIGVRMTLEATPMGIGDPIVQELALQKISYSLKPKDWRVQVTGSPRPVVSYFVLDSSELDGEDVLGF